MLTELIELHEAIEVFWLTIKDLSMTFNFLWLISFIFISHFYVRCSILSTIVCSSWPISNCMGWHWDVNVSFSFKISCWQKDKWNVTISLSLIVEFAFQPTCVSLNNIINSRWESDLHILLIVNARSRLNFLSHSLGLSLTLCDSLRSKPLLFLMLFSLHLGNQFLVLDFLLHRLPALFQSLLTGLQSCYSSCVLLRLCSLRLGLGYWRIISHAFTSSWLWLRLLISLFLLFEGFGSSFSEHASMFTFLISGLVVSRALGLPLI